LLFNTLLIATQRIREILTVSKQGRRCRWNDHPCDMQTRSGSSEYYAPFHLIRDGKDAVKSSFGFVLSDGAAVRARPAWQMAGTSRRYSARVRIGGLLMLTIGRAKRRATDYSVPKICSGLKMTAPVQYDDKIKL
jgi:hypothetical protein